MQIKMESRVFSENMKRVLCGIYSYPDYSKKRLAKILSINESTLSTFHQRLREKNLINIYYIPQFFTLDDAKIMISYGKFRYQFPVDIRESIINLAIYPATSFFKAFDNISWITLGLFPPNDSNSSQANHIYNNDFLNKMAFKIINTSYDSKDTKVWRYFNHAPLICKTYGIELPQRTDNISRSWNQSKFNCNEKLILKSLINDPESFDLKRSEILGLSHPTIAKTRKKLIDYGIVNKIAIPKFTEFPFSMLSWYNIEMDNYEIRKKTLGPLCTYPNTILCIQDSRNLFIISVFEHMRSLMDSQQKIDDFMSKNKISYEAITSNNYSLDNPAFIIELNVNQVIQKLLETPYTEQSDKIFIAPDEQLTQILTPFLSNNKINLMIKEIEKNLEILNLKSAKPKFIINILLELLTEPKYLSTLDDNERDALQIKLIETLNDLRIKFEAISTSIGEKRKKRVIIAEKSASIIELLENDLNHSNFRVVGTINNSQSAFKLYRELNENNQKPDIVITNVFLNDSNGIDAIKMIKEYDPTACIMILTSSQDIKVKNQVMSIGVDDYLIRPITKAQLINRLENILLKRNEMII